VPCKDVSEVKTVKEREALTVAQVGVPVAAVIHYPVF